MDNNLKKALIDFQGAWYNVLENCADDEEFNEQYPFQKCFLEIFYDVANWVESEVEEA